MIDDAVSELAPLVGVKAACVAVGRPRASHYRRHRKSPAPPRPPRPAPRPQPRALSAAEQERVLDVLHSQRFVDLAPAEVHAILLGEGTYLCSVATMYRLLRARHGGVRERRRHAVHPAPTVLDCTSPTVRDTPALRYASDEGSSAAPGST